MPQQLHLHNRGNCQIMLLEALVATFIVHAGLAGQDRSGVFTMFGSSFGDTPAASSPNTLPVPALCFNGIHGCCKHHLRMLVQTENTQQLCNTVKKNSQWSGALRLYLSCAVLRGCHILVDTETL